MSLNSPSMPGPLEINKSGDYPLDQSQLQELNLILPADVQTVVSIDNSMGDTGPLLEFRRGGSESATRQSDSGSEVYKNCKSSGYERQHNGRVNPGPSEQGKTWSGPEASGHSRQFNGNVYGDAGDEMVQGSQFQNSEHSAGNQPHGPTQPHILTLRLPDQDSLLALRLKAAGVRFRSTPRGFSIGELEIAAGDADTEIENVTAARTAMTNQGGKYNSRGLLSPEWTYDGTFGPFESPTGPYVRGQISTIYGATSVHVPKDLSFQELDIKSEYGNVSVCSTSGNRSSVMGETEYGKISRDGQEIGKKYERAAAGDR